MAVQDGSDGGFVSESLHLRSIEALTEYAPPLCIPIHIPTSLFASHPLPSPLPPSPLFPPFITLLCMSLPAACPRVHTNGNPSHFHPTLASPRCLSIRYAGRQRPLPAWADAGAIIGIQGGTTQVRQVTRRLLEAGVPIAALWLQDWSGKRNTILGQRLWWNWELDQETYADWSAFRAELVCT